MPWLQVWCDGFAIVTDMGNDYDLRLQDFAAHFMARSTSRSIELKRVLW
jgi:hypothetical protein